MENVFESHEMLTLAQKSYSLLKQNIMSSSAFEFRPIYFNDVFSIDDEDDDKHEDEYKKFQQHQLDCKQKKEHSPVEDTQNLMCDDFIQSIITKIQIPPIRQSTYLLLSLAKFQEAKLFCNLIDRIKQTHIICWIYFIWLISGKDENVVQKMFSNHPRYYDFTTEQTQILMSVIPMAYLAVIPGGYQLCEDFDYLLFEVQKHVQEYDMNTLRKLAIAAGELAFAHQKTILQTMIRNEINCIT